MRLEVSLFIFALALAFVSGNISYFIHNEEQINLKDIEEIKKLHYELQREYSPYIRIDLNSIYPNKNFYELLIDNKLIENDRPFQLDSSECLRSKVEQLSSEYVNKETLWLAYLCNQVRTLPEDFFISPPYIHSSGLSYAYMQYKLLTSNLKRNTWLGSKSKYMHINELKSLNVKLEREQYFLGQLDRNILKDIVEQKKVIYSPPYYFINTGNFKYYIIESVRAERFFKRAKYKMGAPNKRCDFLLGNACWEKTNNGLKGFVTQSAFFVFFFTIIILGITANGLFTRFKRRKFEEERKKHALRVLTHELRTPISSLLLMIDQLHNKADHYDNEIGGDIVKLEGQVYRLKHLAEKSLSYLQTNTDELINLKKELITSISDFLHEIRDEYDNLEIKLQIESDFSVKTDPYWLKIIISNLIENAKRYGKTPITITASNENGFKLEVKDQGHIPYINMKDLLRDKHNNSKGLGLGMIIVQRTIKEMGGSIKLETNPTRFIIQFKQEEI